MTKENYNMNTMIISAFPACGKTYLYRNQNVLKFRTFKYNTDQLSFLDSDSSKFEKKEGWEKRYIDYIESKLGTVDFIFISQHEEVLQELNNRKIPFVIVVPENLPWTDEHKKELIKQQWFGRFILRDNSHIKDFERWLNLLKDNYDNWTSLEHIMKHNPVTFLTLKEAQYLKDIMSGLCFMKERYPELYCEKGE